MLDVCRDDDLGHEATRRGASRRILVHPRLRIATHTLTCSPPRNPLPKPFNTNIPPPLPPSYTLHARPALTYSLTARFYYGTASNDEWLVYKSALWLTSRHPHLAATLRDSEDGELCLIEATEALPDWISPENSENR